MRGRREGSADCRGEDPSEREPESGGEKRRDLVTAGRTRSELGQGFLLRPCRRRVRDRDRPVVRSWFAGFGQRGTNEVREIVAKWGLIMTAAMQEPRRAELRICSSSNSAHHYGRPGLAEDRQPRASPPASSSRGVHMPPFEGGH